MSIARWCFFFSSRRRHTRCRYVTGVQRCALPICGNERFDAVPCNPSDPSNILFSSGTTKDPKAIPWTHTTPIKAAADAYLHQDVHPDDVLAWPTSFGWMMGPWLAYASLINRATMALYVGSTTRRPFGIFVSAAGVTMLGVVPKLVRAWRIDGTMDGLDWSRIRRFSSTAEPSTPEDMLYLMYLAGYKPARYIRYSMSSGEEGSA